MEKARIAVLVSGGGTNLQALLDAGTEGRIPHGEIVLVVSDRKGAYALERAKRFGIPGELLTPRALGGREAFETALSRLLAEYRVDLVILAGFLTILSPDFTARWPRRILNVHPSLIPSFCGQGFYGLHVHEAALAYGVKLSGATVHFVSAECDGGPIIAQKAVPVLPGDTPETLQKRIMEQAEWKLLPEAVRLFCEGRLRVEGRTVIIEQE